MSYEQREQNWLENAFANLEEACERKDWGTARAICQDVEHMSGNAFAFRRHMNLSMGKKSLFESQSEFFNGLTYGI